ncbi:flagellin-like protein (plasmid) [Sphingomonas paeninsulae]|uniref:Flagellin-like protein n=1 Tax=Sphingomonas paeninsulae TaxID=2319844 RepID=A0A494T795_SPHPE|nr:flagellin-like protein [Sphingomonas paeninsulae]AYJ85207.1 flagellin-like protein [Sphingomonas paeninsulae]
MINGTRFRIDTDIARQTALSARIARGQSDISTTMRLQSASDDPAASARIAVLRGEAIDAVAWKTNIGAATALAARVDSNLGNVGTLLVRARELVTSGASDTLSTSDRASIASELANLADQIDGLSAETDSSGARLYPSGAALQIPMGKNLTLTATTTVSDAFTVTLPSGALDIATILRNAAAAMSGSTAARAAAVSDVGAASDHISAVNGEQGMRAARIDAVANRLTTVSTNGTEELSSLQQTDVAATIAHISADQLSLNAAQAIFAKVNKQTLFDLIG